ncbi:MATE family efflux transporter [bacterium 1XD42-8]|jgi:putative MATE family efflux protein|nr:MATE family efflux transporter [Lachnospiraceae bacterium]RKJ48758.1 MATE family efflux transporter [bacterium 1XD42-8]
MNTDMTQGSPMKSMLKFALPMVLGNLLQQCYNIADTLIVGKFLGSNALAAVGSSFTLMTFLTSILLGLCMGSGTFFSIRFGEKDEKRLKEGICASFALIFFLTLILNGFSFLFLNKMKEFLQVPMEVWTDMRTYLMVIFCGIFATFLYNYFASLLRAVGNSIVPLGFLALSAILNVVLDLWFVLRLGEGVAGAAKATVIAQYVSGIGIGVYVWIYVPWLRMKKEEWKVSWNCMKDIASFSMLTCIQQSVMNLGILLVQGMVNRFGAVVMAAFAIGVKIDAFAYMPVQDFGNAFSTFIAQNYGAKKEERIHTGFRGALMASLIFSSLVSIGVWIFARPLLLIFVNQDETAIIAEGIRYLHIEGAFYGGIGCLFLLYGLYRALGKPGMSVVLTILSLGTRVVLAYVLSGNPAIGVVGIWWAVPIGWFLADGVGIVYYLTRKKKLFSWGNSS